MTKVFIAKRNEVLDFETFENERAEFGDRAIVLHNGKYQMAIYSYANFRDEMTWNIWNDETFDSAFKAYLYYDLVAKHPKSGKWLFTANVVIL